MIKASFRAGWAGPIRGTVIVTGCGYRRRKVRRADEAAFRPDGPRRRRCHRRNPRHLNMDEIPLCVLERVQPSTIDYRHWS